MMKHLIGLLVAAGVFTGAVPARADDKPDPVRAALKRKALAALGPKADGHFLIALEEVEGPKVLAITVSAHEGRDAAAAAIAAFLAGVGRKAKRTFQVVARLEPTPAGQRQAAAHTTKLQGFVNARLKDRVFDRSACYSDLDPASGKSLNQKLAAGTAVKYQPLR